jgi:diguanylate cyclase (GGDEF)-like protein
VVDVNRMRLSLLGRFTVMGLLVVAALGLVIGAALKRQIERRALERARDLATVMAQAGGTARLQPGDLGAVLAGSRVSGLTATVDALRGEGVQRLRIYNRHGLIAYSDAPGEAGEGDAPSPRLRKALGGAVVCNLTGDGRTLVVDVPVVLDGHVEGGLELYLAYGPVAAAIRQDVLTVALLLTVGLLVLFGALFRIVHGASRRLRHQALHDALTGLPNRAHLYRRAEKAVRRDQLSALLLIDLDRFKEVNDTLGHDQGDALLVEVAERLRASVRRSDTLARLGGDEFAVLLTDLPHRGAAVELADRLLEALRRPFALGGVAVELAASIGVALCPDHGTDAGTLVQRADVAMYSAKAAHTGIETYDPERDPYSEDRLTLLSELRRALNEDELVLHYQPKVAVASRAVTGVEALVRWQHPQRGLLGPGEFVPLAERTGMIAELTRWVLEAALAQCRRWSDAGVHLPVAINIAAANVLDSTLPNLVADALARHGVPGELLECEISEHTVMSDPRRAIDVLGRLRALGVRLSLDDFGTGHSSLAYLKRLPLDEVKIDRSFVLGMAEDDNDAVIVRSTIDLARNLGLEVVAEGVETEAVLNDLAALRCDVAQGYLLSRPLPAAQLGEWLVAHRAPA